MTALTDIYARGKRPGPDEVTRLRAALAEAALKHPTSAVAFQQFGDHVYSYPGRPDKPFQVNEVRTGLAPAACDAAIRSGLLQPGDLAINAAIDGFNVPTGLCLVTGLGNTGKTPWALGLAARICADDPAGFGFLRYGEPFAFYSKTQADAGYELLELMFKHRAVVIDSVKDLLTDMSGSATESGIARPAISMLSRMSMAACELGCTLLVPVNPSSVRDSVANLIKEVARSNVSMAAVQEGDHWSVLTRTGEGQMRVEGMSSMKFVEDLPSVTFRSDSAAVAEAGSILSSFEITSSLDISNFVAASRRATKEQ